MSDNSRFQAVPRATFNTAGLAAGYAPLNGAGFTEPLKQMVITNWSNASVDISYDGVVDHDFLPPYTSRIVDVQTNAESLSEYGGNWNVGRFQVIYGKGAAGVGTIYVCGYY